MNKSHVLVYALCAAAVGLLGGAVAVWGVGGHSASPVVPVQSVVTSTSIASTTTAPTPVASTPTTDPEYIDCVACHDMGPATTTPASGAGGCYTPTTCTTSASHPTPTTVSNLPPCPDPGDTAKTPYYGDCIESSRATGPGNDILPNPSVP